jgi:hypothetical protein
MDRERSVAHWSDSIWIGLLLLALGVCGFLDAAGIADASRTIGAWWPLIIVAWAVVDMARAGRITAWGMVWSAVGLALLADGQEWASDTVVWSALAVFVGLVMLAAAARRSGRRPDRSVWASWCGWCGWSQ